LNCAPDAAKAIRGGLEREVAGGICHPQVDLGAGECGAHASIVHLVRCQARGRTLGRLDVVERTQPGGRVKASYTRAVDGPLAGLAAQAAQVGVGNIGRSKVKRRDARLVLSVGAQQPAAMLTRPQSDRRLHSSRGRGRCFPTTEKRRDARRECRNEKQVAHQTLRPFARAPLPRAPCERAKRDAPCRAVMKCFGLVLGGKEGRKEGELYAHPVRVTVS